MPDIRAIIEQIRVETDAPIVLGGSGFSIAPEWVMDYGATDLGTAGGGEEALPKLPQAIGDTGAYASIPGLVYRRNGSIARNAMGMMELSGARIGRRGYVDHAPYSVDTRSSTKTGAVQTKRGCGQLCIYCVIPSVEGKEMRLRPVKDIVDEIEALAALTC